MRTLDQLLRLISRASLANDLWSNVTDECKTHLCFEFISHVIYSILYPYSYKTYNIFSELGFAGF